MAEHCPDYAHAKCPGCGCVCHSAAERVRQSREPKSAERWPALGDPCNCLHCPYKGAHDQGPLVCVGCGEPILPDSRRWAIVHDGEKFCMVTYVITMPRGPYHGGKCIDGDLNTLNTA